MPEETFIGTLNFISIMKNSSTSFPPFVPTTHAPSVSVGTSSSTSSQQPSINTSKRNVEQVRALYAGMHSSGMASRMYMAGKVMALRSKMKAALSKMGTEKSTDEDKFAIIEILNHFDYRQGTLPKALADSLRPGKPEENKKSPLAEEVLEALWKQCEVFQGTGNNEMSGHEMAARMPDLLSYIILASRSATMAMEKWSDQLGLTSEKAQVVAHLQNADQQAPTDEQRARLQVKSGEEVKYRLVELVCNGKVVSKADNWYVPSRLRPEMNELLEETDTPFGKAVAPLKPYRTTFDVQMDRKDQGELFEHRAILYTEGGVPFSEVHERYQPPLMPNVSK